MPALESRSPAARRAASGLVALATVTVLALATAAAHPSSRAAAGVAAGAFSHGHVLHAWMGAPSLGIAHRSVYVYLPASYDRPESAERRYPVLYLLHGWPGNEGDWPHKGHAASILDSMIAARLIPEVIAVMPNGKGAGRMGRSRYVNSFDGRSRMEDFIVRDVVGWADSAFRTRAEPRARALIGLSEGGDAAVNLTLKHPEVFGACGSHSGAFRLTRGFGERRVLGRDSAATRVMRDNSPLDYLEEVADRARALTIYFDCGLGDGRLGQNREFDRRLTELGVPHTYREFPGKHRWRYWRTHLPQSLAAVTSGME
jgi:enterochelin esterase-like enzyme